MKISIIFVIIGLCISAGCSKNIDGLYINIQQKSTGKCPESLKILDLGNNSYNMIFTDKHNNESEVSGDLSNSKIKTSIGGNEIVFTINDKTVITNYEKNKCTYVLK